MSEIEILARSVDLLWVTIAAIIIFFMQAGFAMLESGFVRSKNAVNVIMKNYVDMCIGSIGFWLVGFGLMFGTNASGFIGLSLFAPNTDNPQLLTFVFFQMMFAATAATIVSGALAERIRYWPYIICAVTISSLIYPIFGSWAWGSFDGNSEGWLRAMGYIDFAGSSVVHAVGGWCALAGLLVLGSRSGRFAKSSTANTIYTIPGHNLPLASLGAFILWFGFFAFNAGSTLAVNDSIGGIVLNTHLSGAAGVTGSLLMATLLGRPILMTFAVNGGLGGLVAICAGANAMSPLFALLTGFIAGMIVMSGMNWLENLQLDDAVGAVPVHAFAGTWGTLAIGLFQKGDLFNFSQLMVQFFGVLSALVWTLPLAYLVFRVVGLIVKLRVSIAEERRGLDYSEHYEVGYPEFQSDAIHQGRV